MFIDIVTHSVQDDINVLSTTSLKGHDGADFFAIDSFVHAVAVCTHLLQYNVHCFFHRTVAQFFYILPCLILILILIDHNFLLKILSNSAAYRWLPVTG